MKNLGLHISIKALLFWYIFIFISTEALSYLHLLERSYILLSEVIFWGIFLFFNRKEILHFIQSINFLSKSFLFILFLFLLTFIQGFFSAPNSTDSMVYHIPRIMYWMQEKTLLQDVIRNAHDYMAPFGEYILLHLYLIFAGDRMLFFSQWVAYVISVYITGIIAVQLGADKKTKQLARLFVATLPIAVMQSVNTQVDMVATALFLLSLYLVLFLKGNFSIKTSILLGIVIGLGFLTKATFLFYALIAIGLLFFFTYKQFKTMILMGTLILFLSIILQFRFLSQNMFLYGNFFGVNLSERGEEAVYINEVINPLSLLSNLVRNFFIHLPIPIFASYVQNTLTQLHNLIGFDISDPRITCCGTQFSVKSVVYPQEDIVANPVHLVVIMAGGVFLIYRRQQSSVAVILYLLTLFSFVIFSALIKWQPFHPRLEIPLFVSAIISAVLLLSSARKVGFLYIGAFFSCLLALIVILLNVSRPYISYSLFYDRVQLFKPALASIPEAFYIKPRQQQYFNARYYWYEPYLQTITFLKEDNSQKVVFKLDDGFEYPLWLLMKENDINKKVIPYSLKNENTVIISTSEKPFSDSSYRTRCVKTVVEYGYACFSKRN